MNFRKNNGFTGIDISIALVIMLAFVSLIASLIYSFNQASQGVDRKSEATYLTIQVIEAIKQMNYDDVSNEMTIDTISSSTSNNIDVKEGYNLKIEVENYKDIVGDDTLEDVIKIVTVTVEYSLGNNTEKVDISTVITKEE